MNTPPMFPDAVSIAITLVAFGVLFLIAMVKFLVIWWVLSFIWKGLTGPRQVIVTNWQQQPPQYFPAPQRMADPIIQAELVSTSEYQLEPPPQPPRRRPLR